MEHCCIGVDVGGTHVRIGAADPAGQLLCLEKMKQETVFTGEDPVEALSRRIRRFQEEHGLIGGVDAAAVGFPATLDRECTRVCQAPNLRGLDSVEFAAPLTLRLGFPVFLAKDVWAAFFYDVRKFHLEDRETVVAVYIGTGIGNAVSVGGRLLRGKNGAACELGHLPVIGNELPCGCGNRGCLETVGAGKALAALVQTPEFAGTPIAQLFTLHRDHPALQRFLDYAAAAVATEINLFDPDTVLVGGGVPAMADFPLEELRRRILAFTRKPFPAEGLELIFTGDEEQKGALGAACYARRCLEERRG